jgi:DNA-binding transcriptional LysR family regulator
MQNEMTDLAAFVAVAEERSFTRAGRRIGVSTSALSHAMRRLEERFGVRLLARSTRSVLPTDAGRDLLASLAPALSDIAGALERLSGLRDKPAGRVRLVAPRQAAMAVLAPKLGAFARNYPDVVLDIVTTDAPADLVGEGFDAGIQFGEFIAKDMIAVRVSADHRPAVVGAPSYFKTHPKPRIPRDLVHHRCINTRHKGSDVYRWELDKGNESLSVSVNGPLILDDVELMIRAAIDGVGLAFMSEDQAAPHIKSGALMRVLTDWSPPFPGYFLYYPSRRQQPRALAALIDTLRFAERNRAAQRSPPGG